MTKLLIVILDDLTRMPDLLRAWKSIGVPGATILESAGGHTTFGWMLQMGVGALNRLFEQKNVRRRTLLTVIDDEDLLMQAVAEAERVVGGFERPNSGLLIVVPVDMVKGTHKVQPKQKPETLPPALRVEWQILRDTPIEEVAAILNLEPTIINVEMSLDNAAQIMLTHPNVHVACVVSDNERLVGLLCLQDLAEDIFFHIMPEEFLSESIDLKHVYDFAGKSNIRTAGDAMQAPIWVKHGDKVKDAFKRMHEAGISGLPIIDELYHVVGYINLLELLTLCLKHNRPQSVEGESK